MKASTQARAPVIVGQSAPMRAVFDLVRLISNSESTAIITGESGTGKEVTANLIHQSGRRGHAPFVSVNCALFSESLVESELFGHVRGAFTGALNDRAGRFELAEGGTIFLDDIDDVPLAIQVKLLRVLQNKVVERLGSTRAIPVNVRVLAATKRDLKHMVLQGQFREDLYYRLAVLTLTLPPLRERREDVPSLMQHFLSSHFRRRGATLPPMLPAVTDAFMRYEWPGNVRELENMCERIAQMCTCNPLCVSCPAMADLSEPAVRPSAQLSDSVVDIDDPTAVFLDERLRALERSLLDWAMALSGGNQSRAAELLHVKRSTLMDRLRRSRRLAPAVAVARDGPADPVGDCRGAVGPTEPARVTEASAGCRSWAPI